MAVRQPWVFLFIFAGKAHIIILGTWAPGCVHVNHAVRRSRYSGHVSGYSAYTRTASRSSGNTKTGKFGNGKSVLAKKIILQSLAGIIIIFGIAWLQNRTEELPRNIISEIRLRVVERHIAPEDIYQFFTDAYNECVQYIRGSD